MTSPRKNKTRKCNDVWESLLQQIFLVSLFDLLILLPLALPASGVFERGLAITTPFSTMSLTLFAGCLTALLFHLPQFWALFCHSYLVTTSAFRCKVPPRQILLNDSCFEKSTNMCSRFHSWSTGEERRKFTAFCYRNGSFPGTGKHLFNQPAQTVLWQQTVPLIHHSREQSNAGKWSAIRNFIATSPICPLDWIFFLTSKTCFVENTMREQEASKVTGIASHP